VTAPPTPNAELAYRVLDYIDANPKLWRQAVWVGERPECGTVACFAGRTVLLSGCKLDDDLIVVDGPPELIGKTVGQAADILLGINTDLLNERNHRDPYDGLLTRKELGDIVAEIFGPRPDDTAWRECAHRADYTSAAHHERECPYHLGEVDEHGITIEPVARDYDDVPPNAGSAS